MPQSEPEGGYAKSLPPGRDFATLADALLIGCQLSHCDIGCCVANSLVKEKATPKSPIDVIPTKKGADKPKVVLSLRQCAFLFCLKEGLWHVASIFADVFPCILLPETIHQVAFLANNFESTLG